MNQQQAMSMVAGMLVCILVFIAILFIIQILFCLTLYRTQQKVAERNREMPPGLVWLDLIPIFNTFWGLYMVPKLSDSLRNEFRDRGWRTEGENFGRGVGMIWVWAGVINFAIGLVEIGFSVAGMDAMVQVLNLTSCPIGLTILITWIMYWVQMYQYGKRLGESAYKDHLEADYDDRPRREGDDLGLDDDRRRRDDLDHGDRPRRSDDELDDDHRDRPRRDDY
jgi:hypothetical protein